MEAEALYRQILAAEPDQFDCLHLLGVIFHQRGQHEAAAQQIECALRINPGDVRALNNRGIALYGAGRAAEALASYDRALAVQPDYAEALSNRGVALHALRRYQEALESYERALTARPIYPEALSNRGNALKALGRLEDALASHDRALAILPAYAEAWSNRGDVLRELKRFTEALASYDRALALRPDMAETLSNRSAALYELGRIEEALANSDSALALRPNFAEALANRANALQALKRFDEALAGCDRALKLRPDFAEGHYNRANALHGLQRFQDALAAYDRAIALRPDHAEAYANRGVTFQQLRRFEEALASYGRASACRNFPDARYNEALCRLLTGDFVRGWAQHEGRWETEQLKPGKRDFPQPLWDGSGGIAGKTILLHAEQGFGDTIQFCRYVPAVAARGARVILEVQAPLRRLMGVLADSVQIVSRGETLPPFDLHCPLLSLPHAFGTTLATIPATVPYLGASAEAVAKWNGRLGVKQRPRIGLAWSGRPTHKNDHNRSIALNPFLSALADVDAHFVSLQREVRTDDTNALRVRRDLIHFGEELKDFSDTAALIANLDLVVSVDTSVAHLAGALAKPVWVLLPFIPDWRWLLDRVDSPWYPAARLFRQDETRRWENVLADVRTALQRHVRGL